MVNFRTATIYTAAMILLKSLAGLATLKVQALLLLPGSFGVLSQFTTAAGLVTNISTAAVTTGMTVLLARAKTPSYANQLLRSGQAYSYGLSTIISICFVVLFFYETNIISISPLPRYLFLILAAAPWLITQSSIVQARLTSSFKLNLLARLSNCSVVTVAVLIITLTFYFGLTGSAIAVAIGPMLAAGILIVFAADKSPRPDAQPVNGSRLSDIFELFRYSSAMFIAICAVALSHIFIRESMLDAGLMEQAGFWSATVRVSDVYMQFFGLLLMYYVLPRVASQTNLVDSQRLFLRYLGFLSLMAIGILSSVYVLREHLVVLALAPEFRPVIDLLPTQLLGDFCRVILSFFFWFSYGQNLRVLAVAEEVLQALLFYLYFLVINGRIDAQGAVEAHYLASMTNVAIIGACLLSVFFYRRHSGNASS